LGSGTLTRWCPRSGRGPERREGRHSGSVARASALQSVAGDLQRDADEGCGGRESGGGVVLRRRRLLPSPTTTSTRQPLADERYQSVGRQHSGREQLILGAPSGPGPILPTGFAMIQAARLWVRALRLRPSGFRLNPESDLQKGALGWCRGGRKTPEGCRCECDRDG